MSHSESTSAMPANTASTQPLHGYRVVEFAHWMAGPLAGGVMADWGADVIKVEPRGGEPMRGIFAALGARGDAPNGAFVAANRGKRSIELEIKDPGEREVFDALLDRADVLLTNLRPDALQRLGLDPQSVRRRHPHLVYCSVSAYGWGGPDQDRPGYDIAAFFARSGIAHEITTAGTPPAALMQGIGDSFTALSAVTGVAAALLAREKTGNGSFIEASLLRTGMWAMAGELGVQAMGGNPRPPYPREQSRTPLYNSYRTADGRWFFLVGVQASRHIGSVLRAIGREDLLGDERFHTARGIAKHRDVLIPLFDAAFAAQPLEYWSRAFDEHDVWWAPIQTPAEVVADRQAAATGAWIEVDQGAQASLASVDSPIRFDGLVRAPVKPPPAAGEHTRQVLRELGYPDERIDALLAPARPRWAREVVRSTICGHPGMIYRHRPRSVAELLVDARRWDERTFVIEGDRRIAFAEHERAVARLAAALRARGVTRGERVMLLAFNRLEWLLAFWALQSLGAVAVLGNAWWSREEILAAGRSLDPALALVDDPSTSPLFELCPTLDLGELVAGTQSGGEGPSRIEPVPVEEDDPALIFFSSGTTGAAKGVVATHRSVLHNIQNLLVLTGRLPDELPREGQGTVSLLTVPLFHLAGIQISLTTLVSGGSLVFLEGRFDPEQVLRLIEREKIRVWGSIPTMVSRVLDAPGFGGYDVSSLRSIPMGGAAISPELRQKVQAAFPNTARRVGSLYGLTEAGGVLAAGSAADLQDRPGCVGRALPVVELRIAGADAQGVGEIMARTPTAALGYWASDEAIVDAEGWLRTGDLGRLDDEGYLYVVGRSKDIVIRGGENVACGHVERCLLQHPDVLEAAVVPLPHEDLGEEVGAVVVVRDLDATSPAALHAHAARHLGKFEVPSKWWLRSETLPTNASGKILKRALLQAWTERLKDQP